MNTYLLITSIVIFLCILLNRVSNRIGIPALLAFIVLGMLFGSDGIMKIDFDNYAFAEQICSTALIFIMFYGGFGTNWQRAKAVAVKSVLLSTIGVIITCFLTGLFCHFALNMSWEISFLLGALISSTDAASVFSILRSKKLNLKYNTASLLEVESGSNDPCAYMLTVAFIAISQGSASPGNIAILIVKQLAFGIIFGVLIAKLSIMLLRYIRFKSAGFDAIFMVGIALISYALPAYFDGNGFLSAYIVGIILHNWTHADAYFLSAWSAFFPIKAATCHSTGTFNIYVADLCGKTSFCRTCAHTISQQNKTAAACLMVRLKRSCIHSVFHHGIYSHQ